LSDERLPIQKIINAWKKAEGIEKISSLGKEFYIVKTSPSNLRILAQTLLDNGYSYGEICSDNVAIKLVSTCWLEDKIKKMSLTEVRKAKKDLLVEWEETLDSEEFSGIKMSKPKPLEKKSEPKPETKKPIAPVDEKEMERLANLSNDLRLGPIPEVEEIPDLEFLKMVEEEMARDESDE
jgi:hypothetical protein